MISAFSGKTVYLLLIAFAPYAYPIVPISIAESGHATVPVVMDGVGTREFVLDTGARKTRINWNLGEKLGFSSSSIMAGDVIHGATGNPVQAGSATVSKVKIGNCLLTDMPVQVVDLPVFELFGVAEKPAVVLGLDWLGETGLIVDFPQRRVWVVAVND